MNIDIDRLRSDLLDYFGTGIDALPIFLNYVGVVNAASEIELISIAMENGFDLEEYIVLNQR